LNVVPALGGTTVGRGDDDGVGGDNAVFEQALSLRLSIPSKEST